MGIVRSSRSGRVGAAWAARLCAAVLCVALGATAGAAEARPKKAAGAMEACPKKKMNVSGTWNGALVVGTVSFPLTLQLHQRAGGDVLGLLLGGTSFRIVTDGVVSGSAVTLGFESRDPLQTQAFTLSGTLKGDALVGIVDGLGGPAQQVVFRRTPALLHERRFLFARGVGGPAPIELAVVLDDSGALVSGGFVGTQDCDFIACGGGVTSFQEDPATGRLAIGLDTGGDCSGAGALTAEFDPATLFYSGTYTFSTCYGDDAGGLLGVRAMATRTDDAAAVLATYGRIADQLEASTPFVAPNPSFSPGYLHYGATLADLFAELNGQVAGYDAVQADFGRFRSLSTVTPPGVHPYGAAPLGVAFHERLTGSSGGVETVIQDVDTEQYHTELAALRPEGGGWVVAGNQDPEPAGGDLPVRVADVVTRTYGIWPYGLHGGGHPEGHPGIDFELVEGADVLAMRGGTVARIEDGTTFPNQKIVTLLTGAFEVRYDHLDALTLPPGITEGATVARGDLVGHPGRPCCDEASCGGTGCCAVAWPWAQVCTPESQFFMIHLSVWSGGDRCAYDVLTPTAQADLVAAFGRAEYRGLLTEPFLCNDPNRNGDVFPFVTRWDRTTAVSPDAPAAVRFSSPWPEANETYEWLDPAGAVVASGSVWADRGTIYFLQSWPVPATYPARFDVEGGARSATMLLGVGAADGMAPPDLSSADRYEAVVVQ